MCDSSEPAQPYCDASRYTLMGCVGCVSCLLGCNKFARFVLVWFVLAWCASGVVVAQDAISQGLVAYYPFSGDARDASGSGNDGMVNGATLIADRFGNPDSAYYFNGDGDNIVVPNSTSLDMSVNNQITVSAWVRPEDLEADRFAHIVRKASGRAGAGFLFAFQNRGRELSLGINNSAGQESNTPIDPDYFLSGMWHFVAGTFDGQAFRTYVDGRLIGTELLNQRINPNGDDPMFIGSYWRGQFFKGAIDDLRLYNRALTTTELEQLYQQERPTVDVGLLEPPPMPPRRPLAPAPAVPANTPDIDVLPADAILDDGDRADDAVDVVVDEEIPTDTPVLEPVTPDPVTPEPVTPEPVTPEPVTPEPVTLPAQPVDVPNAPPDTPADTPADTPTDTPEIILPPALQPEESGVCTSQVANYFVNSRRLVIPALYIELLDALSREPTGQFATFAVTLSHEPEGRTFTIVTSSVSLVSEDDIEVACRARYDGERIEIPLLEADAFIQSLPGVRLPAPRQRLELTLRQHGDDVRSFRVENFELR